MRKGNHIFLSEEENINNNTIHRVYVCDSDRFREVSFTPFFENSKHYGKPPILLFKTEDNIAQLSFGFSNFIYFSYEERIE